LIYRRWFFLVAVAAAIAMIGACLSYAKDADGMTTKVMLADKHRGAHIFGALDSANILQFKDRNIDWITLVSWADQKDYDSPQVSYGAHLPDNIMSTNQKWLEEIKLAHNAGFKVAIKPHIWIYEPTDGTWRSDIHPRTADWEQWSTSYRKFIFRWLDVAIAAEAEMFCIGTELTRVALERPIFWKQLIQDIRQVYNGKLTYAANWYESYEQIDFWSELDYIGVQAYFPLTDDESPTTKELSKGWQSHLAALSALHEKHKRPILFTEIGYKSTTDSAIRPWEWLDYSSEDDKQLSHATQANCYEAFFSTVWSQDWFAGAHLWQLRSDFQKGRGKSELDFTPQGKPAYEVIARGFGGAAPQHSQ